MRLQQFIYTINGRKKKIKVKICKLIFLKFFGLMFKKNSPPLLFVFEKEKNFLIHSLFCRPFRAVWIDEDKRATKIVDVKNWKLSISGKGKYLLEIPEVSTRTT